MSTKTSLRATADSWTNSDFPDRNYGDAPGLHLQSTDRFGYIEFSLKALPSDAVVQEAFLEVTLRNDWDGANDLTASRITQRWREPRITFNNAPSITAVNDSTVTVTAGVAGDDVRIDVTAMVAQALAGANWHGIRLDVDTSDPRNIYSSEAHNASRRPRLVVRFGEDPTPPTNLHPGAGHAVNASKPVLAWDCDSQSASWVQIATDDTGFDADTGFASPEFDDGAWVLNTEQLYDLTTTGYGGLADNAARFWTVKIQDEDGNASQFSEPAYFERRTYGTFAIDSPTDGGTVSTDTPTILTTFSGRTLTRIDWTLQVLTVDNGGPFGAPGWHTVAEGSTDDDDFEITNVTRRTLTYKIIARAFDEYPRGAVPNETAYVRAEAEFTYTPGAPDPITGLTLAQWSSNSPVVLASWERASAPDEFAVFVNDVMVDRFDSGDASLGGTSYERLVWACLPARNADDPENEVRIVAVEDNEYGDETSGTITPIVLLAWLLAPDDQIQLPIYGKPRGGHHVAESGKTYIPKDGIPRRIVDSTSALAGKIVGTLVASGADATTAAEARENLLAIKAAGPGANVRLVWMRRNVPVLLEEIEGLDEWTEPLDEAYEVSIPFYEIPE